MSKPFAIIGTTDRVKRILGIAAEIAREVARAEEKHKPMNSPHEGWSVIF